MASLKHLTLRQNPNQNYTKTDTRHLCFNSDALWASPVQAELVSQHPPVVASGLGRVKAATQLLSDGQGDAEGVGPHQSCDVAGRVHQGCVYALDVLGKGETIAAEIKL